MWIPWASREAKTPCSFCGRTDYYIPKRGEYDETFGLVFCGHTCELTYKRRRPYGFLQHDTAEHQSNDTYAVPVLKPCPSNE